MIKQKAIKIILFFYVIFVNPKLIRSFTKMHVFSRYFSNIWFSCKDLKLFFGIKKKMSNDFYLNLYSREL
jgi:hypothetical protein